MTMKNTIAYRWIPALLLIASGNCGGDHLEPSSDINQISQKRQAFSTINYAIPNLLSKIFNRSIRVQVTAPTDLDRGMGFTAAQTSILKWLAVLRTEMNQGYRITYNVEYVTSNGDIEIILDPYATDSQYEGQCFIFCDGPRIRIKRSDWRLPYVYLHELGHAFGLDDLYTSSGVCADGQYSVSVMCSNADYITADDIRGIRYKYAQQFSAYSNEVYYRDQYGGNGGGPSAYECDGSRIVYGVETRSGSKLDALAVLCRNIDGSGPQDGPMYGGSGGGPSTFTCPGTGYVRGFRVRASDQINSIEVACSDGTFSDRFGGGTSPVDVGYYCPIEYPALKGIRVRSGRLIDRLGLVCSTTDGKLSISR